jgi:hypothetical protein
MKERAYAAAITFAAALLIGLPAVAVAQEEPEYEGGPGQMAPAPEPMIRLTGMLESDGAGGWTLVDQASGDSIVLKKKSKKLAEHEGAPVTVTGRWKGGDETSKTFKASARSTRARGSRPCPLLLSLSARPAG